MPLYEYQCKQCGHRFEKIQSFSAPEETECPVCKGEIERLISAPAVQFKGSGWYATDYASKASKTAAAKNESSGSSESASNSSADSAKSPSSNTAAPAAPSGTGSSPSTDKK